jgi:hypothetical protein
MPTYFATPRFYREFRKLTAEQQALFMAAIAKFVEDLKTGRFRKSLRIKRCQGHKNVWELSWAPDGRALYKYGAEALRGEPHVIWLRIGGHEIFESEA